MYYFYTSSKMGKMFLSKFVSLQCFHFHSLKHMGFQPKFTLDVRHQWCKKATEVIIHSAQLWCHCPQNYQLCLQLRASGAFKDTRQKNSLQQADFYHTGNVEKMLSCRLSERGYRCGFIHLFK